MSYYIKVLVKELKMGAGSWDMGEESFPGTSDLLVQPIRSRLDK